MTLTETGWERARSYGLRMALRITRNHEDAEDAVQSAAMKALKTKHGWEGRSAFSSWFVRIAINEALLMLRRRKEALPLEAASHLSARDRADGFMTKRILGRAIAGLSRVRRKAALRLFLGYSTVTGAEKAARYWARQDLQRKLVRAVAGVRKDSVKSGRR